MLRGFDVSHNNQTIDLAKAKAEGYSFLFAKATQGRHFVDPMFKHYRSEAHKHGLILFPYHYKETPGFAQEEADNFLATVGSFSGLGIPALDCELDSPQRAGVDPHAYVKSMTAWLDVVEKVVGRREVVYSYEDFWAWLGNPTLFGDRLLWKADYSHKTPAPLAGWSKVSFHQTSDQGTAAGHGGVDTDVFLGTLADLQKLIIP